MPDTMGGIQRDADFVAWDCGRCRSQLAKYLLAVKGLIWTVDHFTSSCLSEGMIADLISSYKQLG